MLEFSEVCVPHLPGILDGGKRDLSSQLPGSSQFSWKESWSGVLVVPAASPAVPLMLVWLRKITRFPQERAHPSPQQSAAADRGLSVPNSFQFSIACIIILYCTQTQQGPCPRCIHQFVQKAALASTLANAHRVPATDPLCTNDLLMYLFCPSLECYDIYWIV